MEICLYRKRSRTLLDCARSKGNNLGSRRVVERQLRRHVRRSLPHLVSADRRRYDSSSAAAKHTEIPGRATVKSRQTTLMPAPGGRPLAYTAHRNALILLSAPSDGHDYHWQWQPPFTLLVDVVWWQSPSSDSPVKNFLLYRKIDPFFRRI